MILTKEQIKSVIFAPKFVDVECPELGGSVRIAALTAGEKAAFDASIGTYSENSPSWRNVKIRFVAFCSRDQDGKQLFTEADFPLLETFPTTVVDRCFRAAQRINGLDETAEDIQKN